MKPGAATISPLVTGTEDDLLFGEKLDGDRGLGEALLGEEGRVGEDEVEALPHLPRIPVHPHAGRERGWNGGVPVGGAAREGKSSGS